MCNYCGCREFPLISRLTEQHLAIEETAGRLRRAALARCDSPDVGDDGLALAELDALLALLLPHTATEETVLFPVLRSEATLAEVVADLSAEHETIHGVLGAVDRRAPDWPAVLQALRDLLRHVKREEHELFPAAVILLPMEQWDRVSAA